MSILFHKINKEIIIDTNSNNMWNAFEWEAVSHRCRRSSSAHSLAARAIRGCPSGSTMVLSTHFNSAPARLLLNIDFSELPQLFSAFHRFRIRILKAESRPANVIKSSPEYGFQFGQITKREPPNNSTASLDRAVPLRHRIPDRSTSPRNRATNDRSRGASHLKCSTSAIRFLPYT